MRAHPAGGRAPAGARRLRRWPAAWGLSTASSGAQQQLGGRVRAVLGCCWARLASAAPGCGACSAAAAVGWMAERGRAAGVLAAAVGCSSGRRGGDGRGEEAAGQCSGSGCVRVCG